MSLQQPTGNEHGQLNLDSGIEALRSSPEFAGTVESRNPDHTCNDHLAMLYETREEQLAAVVPFVRQGLERGEKVIYVTGDLPEEAIRSALADGDVDVEGAIASGALTFYGPEETYLRQERFEPEEMIEFYDAAIQEATSDGYSALRVAAETTWLQSSAITMQEFLEYESQINDLFEGEDCIALCQYDQTAFEPEVVMDLVQTHPHLIYEGTVCHNVYYTPPAEFVGPDQVEREVDRMMRTLVGRAEARVALQEREQVLRDLYEITADPARTFEGKVRDLLDLGREWYGLDIGFYSRIDQHAGRLEIVDAVGDHDTIQPGMTGDLGGTYCRKVLAADGPVAVADAEQEGWADDPAYETYGLGAYVGTPLVVEGECTGTLCFASRSPRDEPFTDAAISFLELVGQWIENELERERRQRYSRALYELAADTECTVDEKLTALFELGCERFDLEIGAIAQIDPEDDSFQVEAASGDHETLRAGTRVALSETYCRILPSSDGPAAVTGPACEDFEGTFAYEEFGVRAYVGTRVTVENDDDRSLFFVASEPRNEPLTETERTFLDLMSQWVGYELERSGRERNLRTLYELTADRDAAFEEKLEAVLEFGCERFDLDQGYLVNVHPDETVEIEQAVGDGENLREGIPGAQPMPGQFCRRTIEIDEPIGVPDVGDVGWDDDPVYEESGLRSYFGVTVTEGHGTYGTLAFCGTDARQREFTDAEHTFLELMGQWISHELMQRRRQRQLAALNEMGRDLMSAETSADIAERTIEHARSSLDLPVTAVVDYDADRGELSPVVQTPRAEDELPTATLCDRDGGALWETFVAGEVRQLDDVAALPGAAADLTQVLAVPLGRQGLFVAATTASQGHSGASADFLAATAATVEAAYTRADRESQLRQREETLESQNETLERLNRVNDIIRNIDQALVGATSRSEIERVVCEQLAGVGPYELAWIGEPDAVDDAVTPTEWAGSEKGYLEELSPGGATDAGRPGPGARAVETGQPQVVDDVLDDETVGHWRQAALNRGYHACVALPLSYGESLYGVLVVYAGRPGVFEDLERSVLTELADTIGYAINAVESKKALVSDEVVHLEFGLDDADLAVVDLAREFDCEVSLESIVPGSDGQVRAFVSTRGGPPAALEAAASQLPLDEVTLVGEHDGEAAFGLFEVVLPDNCLFTQVIEHGGRPHAFTIDDGVPRLTVELASDAAVREFVTMFQSAFSGAELVAQRTQERPQQTPAEFFAGLTETLTDRQLETLQIAYYSGYLDEPRQRTATELADTMGIAQPTFNSHLRAAQRKLCEQLFDEHTPTA